MKLAPQRSAFTLIELLVVISIIALLISILLPVLGRARESSKQLVCLSNQRQLGIATYNYVTDYKDAFPQPSTDSHIDAAVPGAHVKALWFNALDYYLQQQVKSYAGAADRNYVSFKQDPAWLDFPEAGNIQRDARTIKMNQAFGYITPPGPSAGYHFYTVSEIDTPLGSTVMYLDGRSYDTPSTTTGSIGGTSDFHANPSTVGLRHDDGANVLFADGHGGAEKQPFYVNGSGFKAWFYGSPATNGYTGSTNKGPHDLKWFFNRNLY